MAWLSRNGWFRQVVTLAVILGTLSAADGRMAHLLSCLQRSELQRGASHGASGSGDDCCSRRMVESPHAAGPELCLDRDDCACCLHEGSTHLGEADNRLLRQAESLDLAGWLIVTAAPLLLPDLPPLPVRVVPTTDCSLPAARLFLLLGHLLF